MSSEADFFVAGGTLRTSAPSYVTHPADTVLLQHLQAGEFCYVLTARQMGKSSLMVRTAQRLRAEGVRVVIIDLTSIGASSTTLSADQWYLGLLSRLRNELRLTTDVQAWWQERSAFGVSQRFTDFLHDVVLKEETDKVVLLIDEIDSTLNLSLRDDFFAAIRAIYNERASDPTYDHLTFALFGVATPTDLIQDRERTPFNIGQRIDLREFTLADAEPLRQGLAILLPTYANAVLQHIFHWTNGHPYLTQKLCHAVMLYAAEKGQEETVDETVDQLVYTAFLSEEGRKDPNLIFVQDRIVHSAATEQRQMLRLYRRVRGGERVPDDDRSTIQNRLELYGLVGVAQGILQVRNRIYEEVFTTAWIDSVMPINRRRRTALVAAIAALLVLANVTAFILWQSDPTCSELQAQFEKNITNSSIRLSALAGLFERGKVCSSVALDLFYGLEPQEQIALFVGLNNPQSERAQLYIVIDGIYRRLDTVPEHDAVLMEIWLNVLQNAEVGKDDPLVVSIGNWKEGRSFYDAGEFAQAVESFSKAIVPDHPSIYYDRALSLIKEGRYTDTLSDLNTIVEIAQRSLPTLTPEIKDPLNVSPLGSTNVSPISLVSISNLTETLFALPTAVSISPLPAMETNITETSQNPSFVDELVSVRDYQLRFLTAERLYSVVQTTLQNNPLLYLYLETHIDDYPSLELLPNIKQLKITAFTTQCTLNGQEQVIETLTINHSGQQRTSMSCNPILAAVAHARAEEMGRRAYFGHVNPEGYGPNYLVQAAGYVLPSLYGQDPTSNNIELIGAGPATAQVMFDAWMGSSKHRTHVLAENEFYRSQTEYGIGFAEVPGSPYTYYWVFISAYPGP
ncbi:MAG: AAA-like domain-containing protein [Caldilineaceae bacterium]